jgi:hypothetical protein
MRNNVGERLHGHNDIDVIKEKPLETQVRIFSRRTEARGPSKQLTFLIVDVLC